MNKKASPRKPSAILCADWGKEFSKRAVYVAEVAARVVRQVSAAGGWSLAGVLEEAERRSSTGPVLATFDAPLGVPESYLSALSRLPPGRLTANFLELLSRTQFMPRFFDPSSVANDWSVERPFFSAPAGDGGIRSYVDAAARHGVTMHRKIDRRTGAKAVFVKSGIPGSVGSAACTLWQELAPRLTANRAFRVWPFEGDLPMLLELAPVVVGEIYPRAAYSTDLLDVCPGSRPLLVVAKTDADIRRRAVAALQAASWVQQHSVTFENLAEAKKNEDDFDACVTAAALLRCVLEQSPLCPSRLESAASEGGMLGTGSVNLQLPPRRFAKPKLAQPREPAALAVRRPAEALHRKARGAGVRDNTKLFHCPVMGCDKTFQGSRGGWDGHVGSLRRHPRWHPELLEAEDRKRRFRTEFPGFFR